MRRFTNWYEYGYMAADGRVFDVGVQTSLALQAFREGRQALEAGLDDEKMNGNGSLMRVLPLALWHRGTDEELVRDARLQSRVTHAHPRSQLCCALYVLWARRLLANSADPWTEAVTTLRRQLGEESPDRHELETTICPDRPRGGTGTGYVVDSLHSARYALEAGNYEDVVRAAIRLGNDTDTTAAIAGGLAGLRDGIDAIPERWRNGLRDTVQFKPLVEQLMTWRGDLF